MSEIILAIVGAILLVASFQDIKEKRIHNLVPLSITASALILNDFVQALIMLLIFNVISFVLYKVNYFEKGDQHLFAAVGPAIALTDKFYLNAEIALGFLIIFFTVSAIYSISLKILQKRGYLGEELPMAPAFVISFGLLAWSWLAKCDVFCFLSSLNLPL